MAQLRWGTMQPVASDPVVVAEEIAVRLLGTVRAPRLARFWSVVNPVFLVRSDDAEHVLKLGTSHPDEILREQRVLRRLGAMGLCVPPIQYTQDDLPAEQSIVFTMMPRIGGRNVGERYHENPRSTEVKVLMEQAGRMLAEIDSLGPTVVGVGIGADEAAGSDGRALAALHQGVAVGRVRAEGIGDPQAILDAVAMLIRRPRHHFVHRDYHPHNVLVAEDGRLCAIDWGNAGCGHRMQDLGRCLAATAKWFGHAEHLLAGYCSVYPLSPAEREELEVWRKYALLGFAR